MIVGGLDGWLYCCYGLLKGEYCYYKMLGWFGCVVCCLLLGWLGWFWGGVAWFRVGCTLCFVLVGLVWGFVLIGWFWGLVDSFVWVGVLVVCCLTWMLVICGSGCLCLVGFCLVLFFVWVLIDVFVCFGGWVGVWVVVWGLGCLCCCWFVGFVGLV